MTNTELSPAEWHLMFLLKHWSDPNGARPSELARRQKVTAANVAQQLRNLEKQALVFRTHDDVDRRVVLVKLTSQGRKKLKQVHNEFLNEFEHLVAHMGPDNTEHFIRLLLSAAEFLERKEPQSC